MVHQKLCESSKVCFDFLYVQSIVFPTKVVESQWENIVSAFRKIGMNIVQPPTPPRPPRGIQKFKTFRGLKTNSVQVAPFYFKLTSSVENLRKVIMYSIKITGRSSFYAIKNHQTNRVQACYKDSVLSPSRLDMLLKRILLLSYIETQNLRSFWQCYIDKTNLDKVPKRSNKRLNLTKMSKMRHHIKK